MAEDPQKTEEAKAATVEDLDDMFLGIRKETVIAVVAVTLIFILPILTVLWKVDLEKLGSQGSARGLITFLISLGVISIAIISTLAALISTGKEAGERFTRAKEILTILVGILGTIVGFYFGQATADNPAANPPAGVTQPADSPAATPPEVKQPAVTTDSANPPADGQAATPPEVTQPAGTTDSGSPPPDGAGGAVPTPPAPN